SIDRMSELLLFMAARAQVTSEVIRPALARGEVVLADRFLLSSIVYQGYAGGLEIDSLREIGRIATGNLQPDLTILLDLPIEEARRRRCGEPDRLESESALFHEQVREGFLAEACRSEGGIWVVPASQGVEELHQQILTRVEYLLKDGSSPG
ncbi:MAG: dTMP kinase, partial [Planctomycetia bacterium]|nr:dTMP kinase [Planctomycetia bacterium]